MNILDEQICVVPEVCQQLEKRLGLDQECGQRDSSQISAPLGLRGEFQQGVMLVGQHDALVATLVICHLVLPLNFLCKKLFESAQADEWICSKHIPGLLFSDLTATSVSSLLVE